MAICRRKIMTEWKKFKLSEIGEVVGGATPSTKDSSNYDGNISWITPKDLASFTGRYIKKGERSITKKGFESCSTKMLPKNSILFSSRAPIGYVAIAANDLCTNQGFKSFIPGEKVDYLFMYYVLKHNKSYIESLGSGTTFKEVSGNVMKKIEVTIPIDISVQKKISSIFGSIDDKIELNNKINNNLEQQAQAIYRERFEEAPSAGLPSGWRVVPLGEVAIISNKSFNPLKETEIMLEHYSIPAFDEMKFPVFELSTAIKSNKFVIDASCIMISKLNPTTKRVWKPYCLTDNAVCSTEFIVYKAKDETITDFLYSVIDSNSFSEFMCSHVTGSTGSRQRTTPSDTLSYELILPSNYELAEFQSVVSPMYAQIRINRIENEKLKKLRDSLLPKLMSGELDVSDIDL